MADGGRALTADHVLDRMVALVRTTRLPKGITGADLDSFVERYRPELLQVVRAQLGGVLGLREPAFSWPADLHRNAERSAANLRAMRLLAQGGDLPLSASERAEVALYSGWGGLKLGTLAREFPPGFPVPEARGLIHEYYTPTRVWRAVADTLAPFQDELRAGDARIRALEPSAGIGRALRAFEGWPVAWTAVEYSAVSARLLRALFPDLVLHQGPFEGWVAEHRLQQFDLVAANPPYGPRGAAAELDGDSSYRTSRAAIYFLRRGLDLLRPGGIGVYIIPSGWLTGTSAEYRKYREQVLRRHHLMAAFRCPSQPPAGEGVDAVVYDQFVVDVLLFRSRGGEMETLPASDVPVAEGRYLEQFPNHLLGTPVGEAAEGWEPGMPRGRRGYQVVGRFEGFPAWTERPLASGPMRIVGARSGPKARGGIERVVATPEGLTPELDAAVKLGLRADAFLAGVARGEAPAGWAELVRDLQAWRQRHGDPTAHSGVARLAEARVVGAERLRAIWGRDGQLVLGLRTAPRSRKRYQGAWTLPAVADWLWRQQGGKLTVGELGELWRTHSRGALTDQAVRATLLPAGWALDGDDWQQLVPEAVYLTGSLWPKHDRAKLRADKGDADAARQAKRLREAIGWRSGPDIVRDCLPIDSWLPLDLVADWAGHALDGARMPLERADGLLLPKGREYSALVNTEKGRTPGLSQDQLCLIGWANLDNGLWRPEREKIADENGKERPEPYEHARRKQAAAWTENFRAWLVDDPERLDALELAYNRELRGFVPPRYSADPVDIARWNRDIVLSDFQTRGVRQLAANRSGLLAFDTGLGKTYSGISYVALARQEGWAQRPVVLVPNSIVWKWFRDFGRCLPDYKVLVIGSTRRIAAAGSRKGKLIAEPDSAEERAAKWTAFQAGEADVVLLTYSALSRQKIDPAFVQRYVEGTIALRRAVVMSLEAEDREDAPKTRAPTERKQADTEERIRAWLGRVLAPPKNQKYDPGIDWHQLGVDLLVVDEAQNFKNLFASAREGEKPETKRAWALDFRAASVREHSGGSGIVLLSATPAKNSPTELYTMLHLIRPNVWAQVGIDNHEAFLTRFGQFQVKAIPDAGGRRLIEREVVTAFKNLTELRDVLLRWCDFKVAEDVGIPLPTAVRRVHEVQVTDAQATVLAGLYAELANLEQEIRKAAGARNEGRMRALLEKKRGLALRLYLTYLHPELPGIGSDQEAIGRADPHDAPKLVRCAEVIAATAAQACPRDRKDWCLDCGHIVFVDNVAVHYWMRDLLVEKGIPKERIAILNAIEAGDTELRQQISIDFNGVGEPEDPEYTPPKYDVVIANAVAYEGMDLQRRTCSIHHLDVPWEPATLQQRNGRAVRRGNLFDTVTLHYYFVDGSNEIHRIERIERKRGWMASVIGGQARTTNTTRENDDSPAEDIPLTHAPPEVRERILRERAEALAEHKRRAQEEAQRLANKELREVAQLFARAGRETDGERQGVLRAEAEAALEGLARFPSELWPGQDWHARARMVRDGEVYIPGRGVPLRVGERLSINGHLVEVGRLTRHDPSEDRYRSRGRAAGPSKPQPGVWLRPPGALSRWAMTWAADDANLMDGDVEPDVAWPAEPALTRATEVLSALSAGGWYNWHRGAWHAYAPATQAALWPVAAAGVTAGMVVEDWWPATTAVPAVEGGHLVFLTPKGRRALGGAELLPPTLDGWARLLALAPASKAPWATLDAAARFWFARPFPRGLSRDGQTRMAA